MQWNLLCLLGNKVTSGPENFSKKLTSKMQVKEIRSALPLSLVVAIAAGINICHLCNRVCKRRVSIGQEKFAIKVWTRE